MINALLAGDVWLAPSLFGKNERLDLSLRKIVKDTTYDIFVCNLEAPCSSDQVRPNRRAIINMDPRLLDSVRIAKKNVLTLGNNHVSDFGDKGLLSTIDVCREKGFLVVGAGSNLDEARRPLIIEINRRKIAVMSYAETSANVGAVAATRSSPGIAPLDVEIILEDINDVKNEVEDIWIFLHWGKEFIRYPTMAQRKIGKVLVSGGATKIIGHHPHVLVGYEKIKNMDIYYSIGNFIFPDIPLRDNTLFKWGRSSRSSIVLEARFMDGNWFIDRKHLLLDKFGLPNVNENAWALKRFEKLSEIFGYKDYARRYRYHAKMEKITNIAKKIIRINKFPKDISWCFKEKAAKKNIEE